MRSLSAPGLLLLASALAAQSPASIERAVGAITPQDIRRRIGILADDSMRGRDTPSPELEQVATYIAAEFGRFGLRPGGDNGGYVQRYRILRRQVDTSQSFLAVGGGPRVVTLKPGVDVNLIRLGQPLPIQDVNGPVVLLTSTAPADSASPLVGADVKGAWVAEFASATAQGIQVDVPTFRAALQAGAVGMLIISDRSDAQWQSRLSRILDPGPAIVGEPAPDTSVVPALVEIRDATAARALGIEPAALRAESARRARRLDAVQLTLRVKQRVVSQASAPNVIGVLEGSDPRLRREYVFFTAHMDHVGVAGPRGTGGCQPKGADSICNGADDDASGTTAVIENAGAFSRLEPRPKRSLVFMTVSGEEKGLWGSQFFSEHPTVRLADAVADLNIDMVGRNWKDTIVVIGKEHSDLGATLDRVAAAHPELHMTPIDDLWPQENFYFRSDHYNFARKGVPILFFFNGTHADYHQVTDSPDKIDAEKESRIVKLVFYLGLELANAAQRPKWNPASYDRIVGGNN